jgi:outer membrane protein OmpA-like peptidoglycan-associated protein
MRGNGLFPRQTHFIVNDTQWNPAQNFYSTDYITVKPMLAFTLDFGSLAPSVPVLVHFNIGGVFTEADKQNTMVGAIAVEYRPAEFLTLFADFSGESRWQNLSAGYDIRKDPLWATPGIRINTPSGMYLSVAGDLSMSSTNAADRLNWDKKGFQYSTGVLPNYGVRLSFGWNGLLTTADKLKEGPAGNLEQCSNRSQPSDGVADADGCPDFDIDKIGKPDSITRCWKSRDTGNGRYFEEGCPDPNNAADFLEQGSAIPENIDGIVENNEIPDYKTPTGASADSSMGCFGDPDNSSGYQDLDGCPDPQGESALLSGKENCPGLSETGGGYRDDAGCPDSIIGAPVKKGPEFPREQTLQGLEFKNKNADLSFGSYSVLDRLAKSLKDFPDVYIEVRGYTDAIGKADANRRLSQMRAEGIRQYLINQGIDPQRIRALGFGPDNPVGDNRTAAGRAVNRRIEVVRVK